MIQVNQIKLSVEHTEADLKKKIEKELELRRIFKDMPSFEFKILRKSVDARKKPEIYYIYSLGVTFEKKAEQIILKKCRSKNISLYNQVKYVPRTKETIGEIRSTNNKNIKSPVIIGEGPCGLFAGLVLAEAGFRPIIFERGEEVGKRVDKVEDFWVTGSIDANTNVQYGEGGAGTFSDGKLNTLVKDKTGKNQFVLDTFVKFGANKAVAYDAKPHVGTDVLQTVVTNIRNRINELGGTVIHSCVLTDIVIESNAVKTVVVDNLNGCDIKYFDLAYDEKILEPGINEVEVDNVVLAIGHSARDTFKKLYDLGINIEQKNFAVGIRIQHSQKMIDDSQYGKGHSKKLPPSPYKVTNHTSNGRDVFSFCMCPGGYVVNASSKDGHLCVNGMSYSDRASENANSALIVAIDRNDFPDDSPLAGMYLQEKLEKTAFDIGKGKIPVQLFKDYKDGIISKSFGDINPVFKGHTNFANLQDIFPDEINKAIIESIEKFGYTIEGFDNEDAILAAVESRTSSPIRITRDNNLESNIKGVYPAGEGAGYAGGIMSAAMDGIRVADAIIDKLIEES